MYSVYVYVCILYICRSIEEYCVYSAFSELHNAYIIFLEKHEINIQNTEYIIIIIFMIWSSVYIVASSYFHVTEYCLKAFFI